MKKDQEELLNDIQNTFDSLSNEYVFDLHIWNFKKPLWKNLSQTNKIKYLENTINVYVKYHENFDVKKIESTKDELLKITEKDEIVEFEDMYIYKELYKILFLINYTFQALDILREKDYPRDFGLLQSDDKKINPKRIYYKKLIIGEDKLTNRKEARLKYWLFTNYYKNRGLFKFFLYNFLITDLSKFKALHEENEANETIFSALNFFLMQKTTPDAVIKSLGILLYGELTEHLKIPKGRSKEIIQWIINTIFHSNISTDEFYGHIYIKSSLGNFPIFGASRKDKHSDEEKAFIKKRLYRDLNDLTKMNIETFEVFYNSYMKNPHIQYLVKYPLEFFRENPKYSVINE
ncbi:MAG: hypothetical protein M0R46_16340 [Candidatus Muirbacterium halophilum]|nr:hypothetical protein [Candidatus Muirbacterium halophilum]